MVNKFENVPSCKQNITRAVVEIVSQKNMQITVVECVYFPLALDKSLDVTDTDQCLVCSDCF
jgi:hypothetical protein